MSHQWSTYLMVLSSLCSWVVTNSLSTEFLCTNPTCTTTISTGTVLSEILTSSGSVLKKGSHVDIVGISAVSEKPSLKISVQGEYFFVDPSFIQQTSQPDIKQLKRFMLALNPAQSSPTMQPSSTPSPPDPPAMQHRSTERSTTPGPSNISAFPSSHNLDPTLHSPDFPHSDPHVLHETEGLRNHLMEFSPESPANSNHSELSSTSPFLSDTSDSPDPAVVVVAGVSGSDKVHPLNDSSNSSSSDAKGFTTGPEPDVTAVTESPFVDTKVHSGLSTTTESSTFPNSSQMSEPIHFVDESMKTEPPEDIPSTKYDDLPQDSFHFLEMHTTSATNMTMPEFPSNIEDFGFADAVSGSNITDDMEDQVNVSREMVTPAVFAPESVMIESTDFPSGLKSDSALPTTVPISSVNEPGEMPSLLQSTEHTGINHDSPHTLKKSLTSPSQTDYSDHSENTVTPSAFSSSHPPESIMYSSDTSTHSPTLISHGMNDESNVDTASNLTSTTVPTEIELEAKTTYGEIFNFSHLANDYPSRPGLIQCFAWAANRTVASDGLAPHLYSPLSYLVIRTMVYMFKVSDYLLALLSEDTRVYLDNVLTHTFYFPLKSLIVWILFVVHITLVIYSFQMLWIIAKKVLGFPTSKSVTISTFLEVEERAIQLVGRLRDQEEVNHELAKSNAQLTLELQILQDENLSELTKLRSKLNLLQAELEDAKRQLTESLEHCDELEESYSAKLSDATKTTSALLDDVDRLTKENVALNESFKSRIAELEADHKRSMDDAKAEHEELYMQALEYYNRMKSVQPEMNKLLEARKQAEDKFAAAKAELDGLRKTFVTLKSFELALEQIHCNTEPQPPVRTENSDYAFANDLRNVAQSDKNDSDLESNVDHDTNGCSEEPQSREAELRASLALFLNVGHLQAELDLAKCQAKSEEAKASCERELRENLETRLEELEHEASEIRAKCKLLEEDRNAVQTKLDILSEYFKERELELQRDLGKHVVVGSESSDALNNCRKRNRELEAEAKALRDQIAALRRELAETERSGRRQMAELDKRSHENWLAARAADHQIKELREENALLRQKLLDAERAILPPALRAQQICRSQPMAPMPLPLTALPRTTLRSGLASPMQGEKGSVSGQSIVSSVSQPSVSRVDMPPLPFPPILFPLPRVPSDNSQYHSPSFTSGPGPGRLHFPHGIPPPPPPPPPPPALFASPIRNTISSPLSSNSSVNSSIFNSTTFPH